MVDMMESDEKRQAVEKIVFSPWVETCRRRSEVKSDR